MSKWDELTPQQQRAAVDARVLSGHTSVRRELDAKLDRERAATFDDSIHFLIDSGFAAAAAALKAAAFPETEPLSPP